VDLKTPGSAEVGRNRYENIQHLTANDQVKFVICSREDYDWAVSKLIEYRLEQRAGEVLFSPSQHELPARQLADWIIADNLPVRLQLQLHKILWNDVPGHRYERKACSHPVVWWPRLGDRRGDGQGGRFQLLQHEF